MRFPVAPRTTAFVSGAALSVLAFTLGVVKAGGMIAYNADSPEMVPFVVSFYLVTFVVFGIGIRNLFAPELKTRIPLLYFPTDRAGWGVILRCWGRMAMWFIGGAVVIVVVNLLRHLLS